MQKICKLNSSIDIIPLQTSSKDESLKKMAERVPSHRHFRDPLLISRLKEYMHDNVNKVYLDVDKIADELQRKYREYRGKKRGSFRAMVRRAYDELNTYLSKHKTEDSNLQWTFVDDDDDDEDDDDEVDIESDAQSTALSNLILLSMAKKHCGKHNGNSSDKELIDISSDDEEQCEAEINNSEKIANRTIQNSNPQLSTNQSLLEKPVNLKVPKEEKDLSSLNVELNKKKRDREKENSNKQVNSAKRVKAIPISESKITFADIGGNDKVLKTICKLLVHLKHPEIFKQLGISPPRGFLLHGPPGCGKTLLANAIAGELNVPLLKVAAPELVAGISGESESRIRDLFEQAVIIAPCVVFIDEIDAIAPSRAAVQREMERRIVAQLLSCLDDLSTKDNGDQVLILGATNRPDSLDPALRRAGRFDHEVSLGIPDKEARAKILKVHTKNIKLSSNVDLVNIASLSPGFVGADLVSLIREAAMMSVDRTIEDIKKSTLKQKLIEAEKEEIINKIDKHADKEVQTFENSGNIIVDESLVPEESSASCQFIEPSISAQSPQVIGSLGAKGSSHSAELTDHLTWLREKPLINFDRLSHLAIEHSDFEAALRVIQPSAKREGFATVPDVTWNDIGSLKDIRQELQMTILAPVRHSEHFAALGFTSATGVLLCGPPGCGKTLLAKAIANEAGINFISVKGPELLNMYVGESEKAVRQCFIRARNSAPCVIFFDELDALCPKRTDSDNSVTSRVVNQMLTEMDGVEGREGVFLMAASNRPDIIDPAVLRPGRLDKILYVGLPTSTDRIDILRALTKNGTKPKLAADVDLAVIGADVKCDGYTGADLAALVREAGVESLREIMSGTSTKAVISMRHFVTAFNKIRPSVHEKEIKHYEKLRKFYSTSKVADALPMETPVDATIEAMET
ncbi:nuclear valosin-containing protein-like [Prorops nasuta]|uniref:nuclear valosin-containing protein-like n=1 Tax=Prorops nasuta TaxID=863751 RepID=UPI0034CE2342